MINILLTVPLFFQMSDGNATIFWISKGLFTFQEGSRFQLNNTGDVSAFLEQDIRWKTIVDTYRLLKRKQPTLERLWKQIQKEMDITHLMSTDAHCVEAAPLHELNWYPTHLTMSRGIHWHEYMLDEMNFDGELLVPDCKKISSLIFSMSSYEHLNVSK